MFPLPISKGSISNILQKSGIRYYCLRNLPLYIDENGKIIILKVLPVKKLRKHRQKIIMKRDEVVYKLNYINELAARKLKLKSSNTAADKTITLFVSIALQNEIKPLLQKSSNFILLNHDLNLTLVKLP